MSNSRGDILHFFDYAVNQCRESFSRSINSLSMIYGKSEMEAVIGVTCLPKDKTFVIYCSTANRNQDEITVLINGISNKKEEIAALRFNSKTKKFSNDSFFGNFNANKMLNKKHPNVIVSEMVYEYIKVDELSFQCLHAFMNDDDRFLIFESIEDLVKKRKLANSKTLSKSNITTIKQILSASTPAPNQRLAQGLCSNCGGKFGLSGKCKNCGADKLLGMRTSEEWKEIIASKTRALEIGMPKMSPYQRLNGIREAQNKIAEATGHPIELVKKIYEKYANKSVQRTSAFRK